MVTHTKKVWHKHRIGHATVSPSLSLTKDTYYSLSVSHTVSLCAPRPTRTVCVCLCGRERVRVRGGVKGGRETRFRV
jgi:hypothetical protein